MAVLAGSGKMMFVCLVLGMAQLSAMVLADNYPNFEYTGPSQGSSKSGIPQMRGYDDPAASRFSQSQYNMEQPRGFSDLPSGRFSAVKQDSSMLPAGAGSLVADNFVQESGFSKPVDSSSRFGSQSYSYSASDLPSGRFSAADQGSGYSAARQFSQSSYADVNRNSQFGSQSYSNPVGESYGNSRSYSQFYSDPAKGHSFTQDRFSQPYDQSAFSYHASLPQTGEAHAQYNYYPTPSGSSPSTPQSPPYSAPAPTTPVSPPYSAPAPTTPQSPPYSAPAPTTPESPPYSAPAPATPESPPYSAPAPSSSSPVTPTPEIPCPHHPPSSGSPPYVTPSAPAPSSSSPVVSTPTYSSPPASPSYPKAVKGDAVLSSPQLTYGSTSPYSPAPVLPAPAPVLPAPVPVATPPVSSSSPSGGGYAPAPVTGVSPAVAAPGPSSYSPGPTASPSNGGSGCSCGFWGSHTSSWPSFFSIFSTVADAFGSQAANVFGTTTLLQGLYDSRPDPYSQLLRQGSAAVLNSYTRPNFEYTHVSVIEQFNRALVSRTAAAIQASKFENANTAFGTAQECGD